MCTTQDNNKQKKLSPQKLAVTTSTLHQPAMYVTHSMPARQVPLDISHQDNILSFITRDIQQLIKVNFKMFTIPSLITHKSLQHLLQLILQNKKYVTAVQALANAVHN